MTTAPRELPGAKRTRGTQCAVHQQALQAKLSSCSPEPQPHHAQAGPQTSTVSICSFQYKTGLGVGCGRELEQGKGSFATRTFQIQTLQQGMFSEHSGGRKRCGYGMFISETCCACSLHSRHRLSLRTFCAIR